MYILALWSATEKMVDIEKLEGHRAILRDKIEYLITHWLTLAINHLQAALLLDYIQCISHPG